jgi:hypothetical protein
MIYEGMIEEAFAIIKGARDRYDGVGRPPIPRNPWNEIECGGHYARAMSSWSILLALSGYEYDAPARTLRVAPRITPDNFKAFFCGPEGWGTLQQIRDGQGQRNVIEVAEGLLGLSEVRLVARETPKTVTVALQGAALEAKAKITGDDVRISLVRSQEVKAGESLTVRLD